jgi:filamentous hemagglutinin family protein
MTKTYFWLYFLTLSGLIFSTKNAIAQTTYQPSDRSPVADSTLGTQVSGNGNNFDITGGLNRGQTLFHSFQDFSVPTNGSANFANPAGIRDMISRVTGGSFSDINGRINSNGANFFLINPNGIVFGPNAQLNVGRAFMASTANGINLVDGGGRAITFGTNPNGDAPLLTISPNVFFNVSSLTMGGGNGQINNFGTLQTTNPSQYIGLIGGNVNMNGGQIKAPGANVELGGLSQAGNIEFSLDRGVKFPANVERGNVSLVQVGTSPSIINVESGGGGSVGIFAKDINLQGSETKISSGIAAGLGAPTATAGDIKLDATGNITISQADIENQVADGAVGKGGNIEINSRNLTATDGVQLNASTFGQGDAGNFTITATGNVSFDGTDREFPSGAFSGVEPGAVGKGGKVEINAENLSVTNGAQLSSTTSGTGNAGNIIVNATTVVIDRESPRTSTIPPIPTGLFAQVAENATGNAGDLTLTTKKLSVSNGGKVQAATFGKGNGGNLVIKADEIDVFDTPGVITEQITNINAGVSFDPDRNKDSAGNLILAEGNGGKLTIETRSLSIRNGSSVSADTKGIGNAGGLTIKASTIDVSGGSSISADTYKIGNAGDLTITTDRLRTADGGQISSSTLGSGSAGKLTVNANTSVEIDRESPRTNNSAPVPTGLFAQVEANATGNAGDLILTTKKLSVSNGGKVQAATFGKGNGGNVVIKADEIDVFNTPGVNPFQLTNINAGVGFDIDRNKDSAGNRVQSEGKGGNVTIETRRLSLNNGVAITSDTILGQGGNIDLKVSDYLLMRQKSYISASAGTAQLGGDGGNINIRSPLIIALPVNSDITSNAYTGKGGKVTITSDGLFGIQYRPKGQDSKFTNDITASSDFGQSGNVNITTPGVDPGKDSTTLPTVPTDASNQIAQTCSASNRQNKFTVAGRGGLPSNANEPLTSDVVWQDARATNTQPAANSTTNNSPKYPPPAVGLVFDGKGKAMLVAAATEGQPTGTNVTCPQAKEQFRIRDRETEEFRIRD